MSVPNQAPTKLSARRIAIVGEKGLDNQTLVNQAPRMFETVSRAEKAYILGFFACDGTLDKNGITITLELQARDACVIDLFKRATKGTLEPVRVLKGRSYLRVRCHRKALWEQLQEKLKGRLKADRKFPLDAIVQDEFGLGCMDADGSFYLKKNTIEGCFQHASWQFLNGFKRWLTARGILWWDRPERNTLCFPPSACRAFFKLYEKTPFGLRRKADVLANWPTRLDIAKFWKPDELNQLRDYQKLGAYKLAELLHRSPKAIQIKAFRLGYASTRS